MFPVKNTALLLSLLLLQSCSSSPVKKEPENISTPAVTQTTKPEPAVKKDHPLWLDNPALEGHIVAIGSSGLQKWGGEQAQYLSAMDNAQMELSIEFKKHQKALLALKKKKNAQAEDEDIDQKIKTLLLHDAIVKEEWKDPKTSRLYLWLVLPEH